MRLSHILITLTLTLTTLSYPYINRSTYPQQYAWNVQNPQFARESYRRGMSNFDTNVDLNNRYNRGMYNSFFGAIEGLSNFGTSRLGDYTLEESGVYTGHHQHRTLDRMGADRLDIFGDRHRHFNNHY